MFARFASFAPPMVLAFALPALTFGEAAAPPATAPVAATAEFTAQSEIAALPGIGAARASQVRDDGTIALDDGRVLKLQGIEIARGRLAGAARAAEVATIAAGPLALYGDTKALDRWGRVSAQALTEDGRWLQGELLARGLARVAATPDARAGARSMFAAERPARVRRLGMWADPAYALRRPDETPRFVDSVQVVEGVVTSAQPVRGAVYINFGEDWRRGLGVRVPDLVLRDMELDAPTLAGRRLRVRGWIGKGIGPIMAVSHAEQIELLDGAGG
jgi:endonuclease YncB( thermonuclease family)